jgi:hypothetical protein
MKRIVYLTFYFEPDLCAGSFRNTPLSIELAKQSNSHDVIVDVYTTLPNRYSTFDKDAAKFEENGNLRIHRIALPPHKSGMLDQIRSFWNYYSEVLKLNKGKETQLVFASSSRLFTAFLGYKLAKKSNSILYLDIRDIFFDTIKDVLQNKLIKLILLPILKLIEKLTFNYATHINLISEGFKEYFVYYNSAEYTFFSNGIDEEFLLESNKKHFHYSNNSKKKIVYAGNIGEGQGLHKIIPQAAKLLGENYEFLIIGDGGAKKLLELEIEKLKVNNVIIKSPIDRSELKQIYYKCDYLFLHLNDYNAFRKVLPSKIFELATISKPIIAGVAGYSAKFISNEVSNSFVFEPCNVNALVYYLSNNHQVEVIERIDFINKFKRKTLNEEMAKSIVNYL